MDKNQIAAINSVIYWPQPRGNLSLWSTLPSPNREGEMVEWSITAVHRFLGMNWPYLFPKQLNLPRFQRYRSRKLK